MSTASTEISLELTHIVALTRFGQRLSQLGQLIELQGKVLNERIVK